MMMPVNPPPSQQISLTPSHDLSLLGTLVRLQTDQVSLGVRANADQAVRKFYVALHGLVCNPPNVISELSSKCSPHSLTELSPS
jgi:hypothetical protein